MTFKLIAGKPTILRNINEMNILHLIREEEPISRIEISGRIGISQAAVSRIVSNLIKSKMVKEEKLDASERSVGRQPLLLRFNYDAGFVLSIDVGRVLTTLALLDLSGTIKRKKVFQSRLEEGRNRVLASLQESIRIFLKTQEIDFHQIYAMGVTVPGLVRFPQGIIRSFGSWKDWLGFNLRDYLEKTFAIPCYVEGDVRAVALAEHYMGTGRGIDNMVCLCVTEVGPSAGIIYNGSLIRGVSDSAGEVGSTEVGFYVKDSSLFRSVLDDDAHILFDQVVQPSAILKIARNALSDGVQIKGKDGKLVEDFSTIHGVVRIAEGGDPFCQNLLSEFAAILGVLCINIINLFNPELIVLNGEIFWEGNIILDRLRNIVKKHVLPISVEPVSIVNSELKEDGYILGGASLALSRLFSPPKFDKEPTHSFYQIQAGYLGLQD